MRIEAFIISMASQPAREAQVDAIRSACPLPSSVVEAVDGRALASAERERCVRGRPLRPPYPFSLRPGEIGCFLSHRRTWSRILERGLDAALVLEDDVELARPQFDHALACATAAAGRFGLVRLPLMERTPAHERRRARPECRQPLVLPLGTQAQLVSARAAERLLGASAEFDRPIDVFLQMRWITRVPGCAVMPSGVFDATRRVGGSTIQARRRTAVDVLSHEVRRPLYRLAVLAASAGAARGPWAPGDS